MESRRTFLTGSLAAGALAVAGCSDVLNDSGNEDGGGSEGDDGGDGSESDGSEGADGSEDGDDGSGDGQESDGSPGRYADLVVGTEERPVTVLGQKIDELASVEDFGGITDENEFLGVSPTDVEYSLDVTVAGESYAFVFGPFEFDTVVSEYEEGSDAEVTETESYNDFRTLEATLGENTVIIGLRDGVLVNALDRDRYERVIDRFDGDGTALLGTGTVLDDIGAILGDPDIVVLELEPQQLQIDPTGEAVAGGASLDIEADVSTYTAVVAYETADLASENESDVGDAAVEAEPAVDSVETSVDGRLVVVRGDATTTDL